MAGRSAAVALAMDLVAGEPPNAIHPTVWMGRWLSNGRATRRSISNGGSFIEGVLIVGGGALLTAAVSAALAGLADRAPARSRDIARGVALKPALSLRPLIDAASDVQDALARGRLVKARRLLSWHLVSRDTTSLTATEVAGAAIESVAENLSDSVIAPLLAFRVGGLTAAYVYRMINTADAMFGYRTAELEWFGKFAARTDDLVNLVPARVAATLICCTAPVGRGSSSEALYVALRDATGTASPNAGWPMAAMAGALGVKLTKRGHYSLNSSGASPRPEDIGRSCKIVLASASLAALLCDLT